MDSYGENFAVLYDRIFGDYAEKAAPLLLRYFASKPVSKHCPKVLDLGCGTGRLALRFLEAGYEVTGLDLSDDMLALAEARCAKHRIAGTAEFIRGDMSNFKLDETFGLILSTYNSMNHLDTEEKLTSCFRSVLPRLVEEGFFLFDYHTAKGLREWNYAESAKWEEGSLKTSGTFDSPTGKAVMSLEGVFQGRVISEALTNFTFPLADLERMLKASGWEKVSFVGIEDLSLPLKEPEDHKRIVVIASRN